ncbi:Putative ribonuclease H protein At1g65750, partial [Linum perenne]
LEKLIDSDHSLLFGNVCWTLWKARNARIFNATNDSARSVATRTLVWVRTVDEAMRQNARTLGSNQERRRVDISWDPGPREWMTVNTDGAVNQSTGRTTAGGLIRDEVGHCVAAFTMNIGYCSITRAELRGAVTGLRTAWDHGYRKVELQVDSMTVVELVKNDEISTHQHTLDVLDLQELLRRDWEVNIRHVFKEGNRAADFLADTGFRFPLGVHSFPISDVNLGFHLRYDCTWITESRSITINE